MDENVKAIQDMLFEQWKNGACIGYAIKAMENLEFEQDEIQLVVSEFRELFDFLSIDEADAHYSNSSY